MKTETVEEFQKRGGVVRKLEAGAIGEPSYANRTKKNTRKAEWNKLPQFKIKKGNGNGTTSES